MKRFTFPLALAACLLAAPAFSSLQQPPKKKPAPGRDSTQVDSTRHHMDDGMHDRDHRVDTAGKKTTPPGRVRPTAPDSARTAPRR